MYLRNYRTHFDEIWYWAVYQYLSTIVKLDHVNYSRLSCDAVLIGNLLLTFRGICCLHFRVDCFEDGGSKYLRNAGNKLPINTASRIRRL
jgi:hypothetical protein